MWNNDRPCRCVVSPSLKISLNKLQLMRPSPVQLQVNYFSGIGNAINIINYNRSKKKNDVVVRVCLPLFYPRQNSLKGYTFHD